MAGGPPFLGSATWQVKLFGVPRAIGAVFVIGFSNTNDLGTPLPIDLSTAGLPESMQSVSVDIYVLGVAPTGPGEFTIPIPLPPTPALGYATLYPQFVVLNPSVPWLYQPRKPARPSCIPDRRRSGDQRGCACPGRRRLGLRGRRVGPLLREASQPLFVRLRHAGMEHELDLGVRLRHQVRQPPVLVVARLRVHNHADVVVGCHVAGADQVALEVGDEHLRLVR